MSELKQTRSRVECAIDSRILVRLCFIMFFAVLYPALFIATINKIVVNVELLFAWGIVLYSTVRLSEVILKNKTRLLSLTFWVFVYVFLGFVPLLQVVSGLWSFAEEYSTSILSYAFVVTIVGLLSFDFGSSLVFTKPKYGVRSVQRIVVSRIRPRRALMLAALCLVVMPYVIYVVGGLEVIFMPRDIRFEMLKGIIGGEGHAKLQIFLTLMKAPLFVVMVSLLGVALYKKRNGMKIPFWLGMILVATVVVLLVINNPIATPRYWLGVILIAPILMIVKLKNYSSMMFSILLIIGLTVVFPFSAVFRGGFEVDLVEEIHSKPLYMNLATVGHFDAFQQIVNSIKYVEKEGHTYGSQITGALMYWYPRAWWTNKPISSGQLIGEYNGYPNTNLSMPLWGEFYLDGGLILVIVMFLLYGMLVRNVESRLLDDRVGPNSIVYIFVCFYAPFQILLLRGALMPTIAYITPVLVLFIFLAKRHSVVGLNDVRKF